VIAADDGGVLGLEGAPPPLRLSNFPLRDEGWIPWAMLLLFGGVAALAGAWSASPAMGGLLLAALLLAGWRIWVPVRFEIGPTGVTQTVLGRSRTVPWTRVARFDVRNRGVLLLGDDDQSPLASVHGLYIHWGKRQHELLEMLHFYLEAPDAKAMQQSTRTTL
jgi:hypothetical protein